MTRSASVTTMEPDVQLTDQAGRPWRLSDHGDAAVLLVFLRGDW